MTAVNKALVDILVTGAEKGFKNKTDFKKMFFTIHQMVYSVYTKSLQTIIKNKKSDISELFVLRTLSLIILSFSEWKRHNFKDLFSEYFKRWQKILKNCTFAKSAEAFNALILVITCICYLIKENSSEKEHMEEILWNSLFLYFSFENKNRSMEPIQTRLTTLLSAITIILPDMQVQIDLLSKMYKCIDILLENRCLCEQNEIAHVLEFTEVFSQVSIQEQECEKIYSVLSVFCEYLKDNPVHCGQVMKMFHLLVHDTLSSKSLMTSMKKLSFDIKKEKFSNIFALTLYLLRDVEYSQDMNGLGECKTLQLHL